MDETSPKPNGEPEGASELISPLRIALEGKKQDTNPAAAYGIPVGARLEGPWGLVPSL